MRGQWPGVLPMMMMAAMLCAGAAPVSAAAADHPRPTREVQRGRAIYVERCAVCHGDHGKGDGVAASALKAQPTNLATLQKENGTFPADRVAASIKGMTPVVAHGIPGMMVWGAFFRADVNGNEAAADARIGDVVKFIESIQSK